MVVRFGSARGNADGQGRLRGEEVAGAAPLPTERRQLGLPSRPWRSLRSPAPSRAQTRACGSERRSPAALALRQSEHAADFRRRRERSAPPQTRRRRPGRFSRAFRAPAAPPVYGSPTGFGAGDTGFDSSNVRARLAQTPNSRQRDRAVERDLRSGPADAAASFVAAARLAAAAAAPVIYPSRAASRPGAALPPPPDLPPITNPPPEVLSARGGEPAGRRAGPAAADRLRPPRGRRRPACRSDTVAARTLPSRALPFAGADPYAALGIRAGSFLILPSLELSAGLQQQSVAGARRSGVLDVLCGRPELQVRSDWSQQLAHRRHRQLLLPLRHATPSRRRSTAPFFNAKFDGRSTSRAIRKSCSKAASSSRPTIQAARIFRPASPRCRSTPRSAALSASRKFGRFWFRAARHDRPHQLPDRPLHRWQDRQ